MFRFQAALAGAVAMVAGAVQATAAPVGFGAVTTIVDTGPPQLPATDGLAVGPGPAGMFFAAAARFTLDRPTVLRSVEAGFLSGPPGVTVGVSIAANGPDPYFGSRSGMPGATIHSGRAMLSAQGFHWAGVTDASWLLPAGDYWAVFGAPGGDDGSAAIGIAPPRPSAHNAFLLVEGGRSIWYALASSHSMAFRISGAPMLDTAAVPEPATWAMMIAGFGLVGAALRRRRELAPA